VAHTAALAGRVERLEAERFERDRVAAAQERGRIARHPASVSHVGGRRCSTGVGIVGHGGSARAAALPAAVSVDGHGPVGRRAERKDSVVELGPPKRGAVRADLEEVFRTTYPRVVAVAARVLGSGNEAEDVAQEVFLTFGRSSVPAAEAMGWLSVAAAHTALNHLRSGRRRAAREGAADNGGALSPDVADTVVTRDERRWVRAALARLPRKQAIALVLRHSGLSYTEVAAALELSPGSVGTTVRRAESALRKELNRHASSD
jgi:RNA polymerase sigma-70 factor (ECF subfamily)